MQYGRDGWQRKMKLAEIEIYWSFAIHSALTLSLGSAGPEKTGCGWLVCKDRYAERIRHTICSGGRKTGMRSFDI
jgi:hypothetical protein